jgi:hypothetical protein
MLSHVVLCFVVSVSDFLVYVCISIVTWMPVVAR